MNRQPSKASPCVHCGEPTKARHGMCRTCATTTNTSRGDRICVECGVARTSRELCGGCVLAIKDDEGVRGLGESRYDLDDLGHWVVGRFGIKRWVAGPPMPRPKRKRRSPATRPIEVKPRARSKPLPNVGVLREFTDDECRDGRARYVQGDRSLETLARNREYGRVTKAARRQSTKTRPRKVA
jgi:hypothetical protein